MRLTGQQGFYRLAHNLHAAGKTGLKRELDKASRKAGQEVEREVRAHTRDYIPQKFESPFELALDTRIEVKLVQQRRISVVFWAMGKRKRRDIRRINEGILRHPVYGRTRRLKDGSLMVNPWVTQRIRPGLVSEPAKRAMPRALKHIEDAVARVVKQI